jgi:deoxyribonuclease (pyrimidine dimer)
MTRINCLPVNRLRDDHLGAEYNELPRAVTLAREALARGERPDDPRNPDRYTLGEGHVRFFYPRMGYLQRRWGQIVAECLARGRVVNYPELDISGFPPEWCQDWDPDARAFLINLARILERGGLRPDDSQEAFLTALEAIPADRPVRNLYAWLAGIDPATLSAG